MKLNQTQIKEIRNSDKPFKVLARQYNVNPNTIKYHKSGEFKFYIRNYQRKVYGNLSKQGKKDILEKKREYQREYHKNRYKTDKEFRNKQIESAKKYQRGKNERKS